MPPVLNNPSILYPLVTLGLLFVMGLPFLLSWGLAPLVSMALAPLGGASQTYTIARATSKEAIRQPFFILMLLLSLMFILVITVIPFFTLGDDIKMLKECGMSTILIAGLMLAVWTSSTSIADEIEGKTAMTLLSKPVNRVQFILGKYFGIMEATFLLMWPLAIWLMACCYYKVFYDSREGGAVLEPTHLDALQAAVHIVPALLLLYFETSVMTAVSVALSTRSTMVVNIVTCLAIYVVGHLANALVYGSAGKFEIVGFMARIFATVLPNLDVFNVHAAVSTGQDVPPIYLGYALLYTACYTLVGLFLAFILFEDRDLA